MNNLVSTNWVYKNINTTMLFSSFHFLIIYFAGQIIGVEGYLESASMGLLASLSAVAKILGKDYIPPPRDTALGALINYLTTTNVKNFQPMNINFGLFRIGEIKIRDKKERNQKIASNALENIKKWEQGLKGLIGSAA